jgi:hypothetical protein
MLADYVYITLWEGAQGEEELQILFYCYFLCHRYKESNQRKI